MAIKSAYRQQITYPVKADAQEKTNFPRAVFSNPF